MFKFIRKPTPRKKYREELLFELTGRNRKAIQAWFRRNCKSVEQPGDVAEYIKKFSPFFNEIQNTSPND